MGSFANELYAQRAQMVSFDPAKELDDRQAANFDASDADQMNSAVNILVDGLALTRLDGERVYTEADCQAADPPYDALLLELKRWAPTGWFAKRGFPMPAGVQIPVSRAVQPATPAAPPNPFAAAVAARSAQLPQSPFATMSPPPAPPMLQSDAREAAHAAYETAHAVPAPAPTGMNRGAAPASPFASPANPTAEVVPPPAADEGKKKGGWPKGQKRGPRKENGESVTDAAESSQQVLSSPEPAAVAAPSPFVSAGTIPSHAAGASVPSASPNTAAHSAPVAVSSAAAGRIGTLYVKCMPVAGDGETLRVFDRDVAPRAFDIVREMSGKMAAADQTGKTAAVEHWRYMKNGRGAGLLAQAVASVVEGSFNGEDLVILGCDELEPCYTELAGLANRVVRGIA